MAVHLDDFQIILGIEFLNAARALAILFDTMHPGKSTAVNTGAEKTETTFFYKQAWTRYTQTTY